MLHVFLRRLNEKIHSCTFLALSLSDIAEGQVHNLLPDHSGMSKVGGARCVLHKTGDVVVNERTSCLTDCTERNYESKLFLLCD